MQNPKQFVFRAKRLIEDIDTLSSTEKVAAFRTPAILRANCNNKYSSEYEILRVNKQTIPEV